MQAYRWSNFTMPDHMGSSYSGHDCRKYMNKKIEHK